MKKRSKQSCEVFKIIVSAFKPDAGLLSQARELGQLEHVAAIFRSHPSFATPERLVLAIKRLLANETFRIFEI